MGKSTIDSAMTMRQLTETVSRSLRHLHVVLRAINRGRIYGLVYTIDNTAEEAIAELRFVVLRLYTTLLEVLAQVVSGIHDWGPALFTHDMEMATMGKLRVLSNELEKAAQNCEKNLTRQLDQEFVTLLRETPHFCEEDVPALSPAKNDEGDNQDEDENEDERLARLDWISDLEYHGFQERLRAARTPGTCEWLLEHNSFASWVMSDENAIFLLEGSCKPAPPLHKRYKSVNLEQSGPEKHSSPRESSIISRKKQPSLSPHRGWLSFTARNSATRIESRLSPCCEA